MPATAACALHVATGTFVVVIGAGHVVVVQPFAAVCPDSVQDTLEFFRQELTTANWTPWSLKEGANPPNNAAGVEHEKGGYAYYVRDAGRPS